MFVWNGVSVLLQKTLDLVSHVQRIMCYSEGGIAEPGFLENVLVFRFTDLCVEFLQKRSVSTCWQAGFLIQKSKNPKLSFDDVDARLIVRKIDECPIDRLLDVFLLFKFKNVRIELLRRSEKRGKSIYVKIVPLVATFHSRN